jgi:formylglycine-generating enzyme required for sulfatase activity
VKADAVGEGPGGTDYTYANKPVNFVSWHDAARFANWLHNGQPAGEQNSSTTEDGAYTFSGPTSAGPRNVGAEWFLPSEDEWYKAAYHKNDGVTGNYWNLPTGTDALPDNNLPTEDSGNSANFLALDGFTTGDWAYPLTDVGAYTLSDSPYGTFDQGGNLYEWTETQLGLNQVLRGGSWSFDLLNNLTAANRGSVPAGSHDEDYGFRVAGIPVASIPESRQVLAMGAAAVVGLGIGRWLCSGKR